MSSKTKAWLALLSVCIIWGTTYLAIKIGVTYFPPFFFAAVRQLCAGSIIMIIALCMQRKADLSWKNLRIQMLIGLLMITLGNGLVTWGEKYIPSGVAALICAMMPVFGVMINLGLNKTERLNALIIIGMLLGFCGVALNFRDNIADLANTTYIVGIIATLCATTSWAVGSILGKRKRSPVNPVFNSGLQLFSGGFFLAVISPLADNYSKADFTNTEAWWSLAYLIIIGSVLAYTAYMYALKELPVGIVMIYAYVNPLVAVVLGWWWLHESLTWYTGLSFVAIVAGVYLVNMGYKKEQEKALAAAEKAGAVL